MPKFGIGFDRRLAGFGATPTKTIQKRPVRTAETDHRQFNQSGDQARMVYENAEYGTSHVPQYRGHAKNVGDLSSLSSWTSEQFDPRLSWDDVARIKDLWGGKLIIKGIMEPEDAEKAAKSGADALVVSNHGGRQLDDTVSSIKALPDIVSAVGSDIEVWMDSGIRSGQDILKAWALGAKGTMIGRAFLYGLGAYGEEGVTRALEILYKEMDVSMAFTGHRNIQDVDASILQSTRWPNDKF